MPSSPSAPSGLRSLGEHLCASFPITPSRTYGNAALKEGRVHLDLLAGRENARGTVGGNAATTITDGTVQLNVAAGSLDEDTAIAFFAYDTFSSFIPSTNEITPLGEVTVDLGSSTLNTSASLTFRNVAAAPGDTLVVARVDRAEFDGIPRLQVVALADVVSANGETSAVSRVETGVPGLALDGIKAEGRYTLLRLANPIGWLKGVTTAGGSPVRALVSTGTPPFFATSNGGGAFAIPAAPGAVTLAARVLGQSLTGTTSAVGIEGTAVTADIALQGTVSQATVVPVSGSVGVEVNEPLTLTSPVALNPNTVIPANISLRRVPPQRCADPDPPAGLNCAATQIPLRLVLSGSGKQLSIVPTAPVTVPATPALEFSTDYRLEVTGLLDSVGGLVTAPTINFRTKDDVKPVYNLKALTFSFPDADGLVTVSAPNGTFPPGTEILIINGGNGVVLGLTAGNDGQVSGKLPAGLSDTLFVTVTDPFGNTTSFESSKFVDPATGQTAIGPGGGSVEGPDGAALDFPEGALTEGLAMKLDVLTPEQYDVQFPNQHPAFGTRPIGTVLKISAAEARKFEKPVKLTFNVPSNFATTYPGADPRDAVFYTLKRAVLENGAVVYEVLDHAFAVCPGDTPGAQGTPDRSCDVSDLKVKTASPPFPEFSGNDLADVYIVLTYDWAGAEALARASLAGAIVGRVRRQAWGTDEQAGQVGYEAVSGARVFGSDADGNPLQSGNALFTTSQKDGTYTLWDSAYRGGTVKVHAQVGTETRSGLGFEGDPQDVSASWGPFPALKFYANKAHVDILFEAQQPPPPAPDVSVLVVREADRVDTKGLSTVGTPLRVGFKSNRAGDAVSINSLDINGVNFVVTVDPSGALAGITQDTWTPTQAGTYLLKSTALSALGGAVPVTATVRIVAAGGGIDTDNSQPPRVLEQRTYPKANAKNVQTNAFPTIAFSEPVVGITLQTVRLTRRDLTAQGPVPAPSTDEAIKISAVTAAGQVIDDITLAPTLPVTAITIQPLFGLKYKSRYTLTLNDGIQDLDTAGGSPAPKNLVPYTTTFDTFGPESIPPDGEPASYTTTGFYVAKNEQGEALSMWSLKHQISGSNWYTLLTGYDMSDPINVVETTTTQILGRPMDVAGEGTTIAVATAPGVRSIPSNVWLYDVSDPQKPTWIGAASVASSVGQGAVNRVNLRRGRLYSGTYKRGIQILDVGLMKSAVLACCTTEYFKMLSDLSLDGQGFNDAAIITSIPVQAPGNQAPFFTGIKSIAQGDDPLIVGTGNFGLALAKESSPNATLFTGTRSKDGETLQYGLALDVATVGGYDIAVVAAMSGVKQVLMTVDVTNPSNPVVLGVREIATDHLGVADVLVNGSIVYVSTQRTSPPAAGVEVFEISDPAHIAYLGRVEGVGGRLAIAGKLLYGATSSTFGAPIDGLGGVRTAVLGKVTVIKKITENPVILALDRTSIEPQQVTARVVPAPEPGEIHSAELEVLRDDSVIQTIPIGLDPTTSEGMATIPPDITHPLGTQVTTRLVVNRDEDSAPNPQARRLNGERFEILPSAPDSVEVGGDPLVVVATNAAISKRLNRAETQGRPRYTPPLLNWAATGMAAGVSFTPSSSAPDSGFYATEVGVTGVAGTSRTIELRNGDTVLARSPAFTIEAGPAAGATPLTATRVSVPADGTSETVITLAGIKDASGNTVADGTPVSWTIQSDDGGDFVPAQTQTTTTNGQAQATYRASIEPGPILVEAETGGYVFPINIDQAALDVTLAVSGTQLTVAVSSVAGVPANGTLLRWALLGARVDGADSLQGGSAQGSWLQTDPERRQQLEDVFVTIGRARAHSQVDRLSLLPPGPRLRFDQQDLIGDRTSPFVLNGGDGSVLELPSSTTMHYEGGAPNTAVTLVLGSMKSPAFEPLAEFPMDVKEAGNASINQLPKSPDIYGVSVLTLPADAEIDYGLDGGRGRGALRLHGEPASLSFPPNLTEQFGFNAYVRFETLTPGQQLVAKTGSFSVETVDAGGGTVFEFAVISGGVRRRVLSTQALAASTWYQVAAHFRDGRLRIQVGNEPAQTGESSNPADASALAVSVGANLDGQIDALKVYDFGRTPLFTFANGLGKITVATDANGSASAQVVGTGSMRGVAAGGLGSEMVLEDPIRFGGPSDAPNEFTLQEPPPTVIEGPNGPIIVGAGYAMTPEDEAQFIASFRSFGQTSFDPAHCLESLKTGEPAGFFGWVCELGAGFTGIGGFAQGLRDATITGANFLQSKRDKAAYRSAAIGMSIAIVGIIPGVRALSKVEKLAKAGKVVVAGSKVEAAVAKQAARELRIAAEGGVSTFDEATTVVRQLEEGAEPTLKQATSTLFETFKNSPATAEAIDRIAKAGIISSEELTIVFDRLRKSGRFADAAFEQVIRAVDQMPGIGRLTGASIEGMTVFAARYGGDVASLPLAWRTIKAVRVFEQNGRPLAMSLEDLARVQTGVLDQTFAWLKELNDLRPDDVAKFAGQIKSLREFGPNPLLALNKLKGVVNQLEETVGFGLARIESLDTKVSGYFGRPDIVSRVAADGSRIEVEIKNITTWSERDLIQLDGKIDAAITRAGGAGVSEALLSGGLERMQYLIRGPVSPELRKAFVDRIKAALIRAKIPGEVADRLKAKVVLESRLKRTPF